MIAIYSSLWDATTTQGADTVTYGTITRTINNTDNATTACTDTNIAVLGYLADPIASAIDKPKLEAFLKPLRLYLHIPFKVCTPMLKSRVGFKPKMFYRLSYLIKHKSRQLRLYNTLRGNNA